MAQIPMREIRPYGSIAMRAPADWFQDGTAAQYCFYYYPDGGGPPVLHVRRDDFVYTPEDGAPPKGAMTAATGGDAATDELYQKFSELVGALDQPDIVNASKEPRTPLGQVVRYSRQGELNGQPGVAHWWLRAMRAGESFTVLSVALELYADGYVNPENQALINAIDRSVAEARILSLEEATKDALAMQEVGGAA